MTAKCLFGPPAPAACMKLAEEVIEKQKKKFENRWNVTIVSSLVAAEVKSEAAAVGACETTVLKKPWEWEQVYREGEVNSRVPLMYVANADNVEPEFARRHGNLIVSMDTDDVVPGLPSGSESTLTGDSARRSMSPGMTARLYSVHKKSLKSPRNKSRLVGPPGSMYGESVDKSRLKQPSITDYLKKVKKVRGGSNAIKTMR